MKSRWFLTKIFRMNFSTRPLKLVVLYILWQLQFVDNWKWKYSLDIPDTYTIIEILELKAYAWKLLQWSRLKYYRKSECYQQKEYIWTTFRDGESMINMIIYQISQTSTRHLLTNKERARDRGSPWWIPQNYENKLLMNP